MSPQPATPPASDVFAYFEAELHEIQRHKHFESEKAGHDIGFERALKDWHQKHRENLRTERKAE